MPWLIDGSNVLGAMRLDRHGDDSKRRLAQLLGGFARARKTRVTCVFDGPEPASFGKTLGSVSIVFSGSRTADDLIVERASQGRGWSVVTADAALAARVKRRQVDVVAPAALIAEMESLVTGETDAGTDWDDWFSDPGNRMKF